MLEILKYPDPRLKNKSKPVTSFDKQLQNHLGEMAKTMYAAKGVGLAAPQVGEFLRYFIVDIGDFSEDESHKGLFEFINPRISKAKGSISFEEGCLSVPGFTEKVTRKESIVVDFQDRFGQPQKLEAHGLLAVAIQHENDHLDGVLFVDRLSLLKRRLLKSKLQKAVTL